MWDGVTNLVYVLSCCVFSKITISTVVSTEICTMTLSNIYVHTKPRTTFNTENKAQHSSNGDIFILLPGDFSSWAECYLPFFKQRCKRYIMLHASWAFFTMVYLQKETVSQGLRMLHKPKILVRMKPTEHVTYLFLRFEYKQNYMAKADLEKPKEN